MSSTRVPSSTYDLDLMLRISAQATARTVHRRPDQAAPARPTQPVPEQPAIDGALLEQRHFLREAAHPDQVEALRRLAALA
ncbi:hypothetical protein ACIQOV_42760 [Kitasatospora sp. NPDC091257]|uniref:hypothetical protein n=1 Tax=Kitasatospora sp. NPDC091257 TaxID=3364084 RepID=UPI00380A204E